MTTLLEKAIKKLEDLPKKRQDNFASIIFDELESEVKWNKLIARTSKEQIRKMERMVREDVGRGVRPLSQLLGA